MDYVSWRSELAKDADNLELLLLMMNDITPEHDSKLQTLFGCWMIRSPARSIRATGRSSFSRRFGYGKLPVRAGQHPHENASWTGDCGHYRQRGRQNDHPRLESNAQ